MKTKEWLFWLQLLKIIHKLQMSKNKNTMSTFKGIAISPKAMIHTHLQQIFIYIFLMLWFIQAGLEKPDLSVQYVKWALFCFHVSFKSAILTWVLQLGSRRRRRSGKQHAVWIHALLDNLSDTVAHFGFKLYLVFTLVLCSKSILLKTPFTAYQRLYFKQTVKNYSSHPWFSFFLYYLLCLSLPDQKRIFRSHVTFLKGFNSQQQFRFTLHVKEVVNMLFFYL